MKVSLSLSLLLLFLIYIINIYYYFFKKVKKNIIIESIWEKKENGIGGCGKMFFFTYFHQFSCEDKWPRY